MDIIILETGKLIWVAPRLIESIEIIKDDVLNHITLTMASGKQYNVHGSDLPRISLRVTTVWTDVKHE